MPTASEMHVIPSGAALGAEIVGVELSQAMDDQTFRAADDMACSVYVPLQNDHKIAVFTVDAGTGTLTPKSEMPVPGGPSPLAISLDRTVL